MSDFAQVVVGYDGSENARRALEVAAALVSGEGIVHVVTAYELPVGEIANWGEAVPRVVKASFDPQVGPADLLRQAEERLAALGADHESYLVEDDAAAAILDIASDVGADLIVVGSRGLRRGTRFIRGSVSSRIASHARTSFMVVHVDD